MMTITDLAPSMPNPPFVLILGMHRSGTSCLAGALERCGLDLGQVRRTGKHNAKGYFESRELVQTHDAILASNGGSWDNPPDTIRISPAFHLQLKRNAATLARKRPSGLKDPRMLLMLDSWADIAPRPMNLVGTFRHPHAVAASLRARNAITLDDGLRLWAHYNNLLVARHRSSPFPLIRFDLSRPNMYRKAIADVATTMGLQPSGWRLRRFISKRLDHQGAKAWPTLSDACADLYGYLSQHCLNPPLAEQFR